jgi:hypothetical protein
MSTRRVPAMRMTSQVSRTAFRLQATWRADARSLAGIARRDTWLKLLYVDCLVDLPAGLPEEIRVGTSGRDRQPGLGFAGPPPSVRERDRPFGGYVREMGGEAGRKRAARSGHGAAR